MKTFADFFLQRVVKDMANAPVSTLLNTSKLGLFMGAPTIGPGMVPGDFTGAGILPTFTGYAVKAVTWSSEVLRLPSGLYILRGTITAPFAPSDGATPNTITGAYMTDSGGTHVLWAYTFATAKPMIDALSFISIAPQICPFSAAVDDDVSP